MFGLVDKKASSIFGHSGSMAQITRSGVTFRQRSCRPTANSLADQK
jgi:hypothetical protein